MKRLHLPEFRAVVEQVGAKRQIYDSYRRSMVALTPEEWVRQHFLHYLTDHLGYPYLSIAVECRVDQSLRCDRTDAMIYGREARLLALVECKAPDVSLTERTLQQILRYNYHVHAPLLMLTNGLQHYAVHVDYTQGEARPLSSIPDYSTAEALAGHVVSSRAKSHRPS